MKISSALLFFCTFSFSINAQQLNCQLSAKSAILINAKTGAILYEKKAHEPFYPASITKIATALYLLTKGRNFQERVVAKKDAIASISPQAKKQSNYRSPPYWLETDATHIGIKKGEEFVLKDLFYAMLVTSANDASNVIAEHVGHTIPKYMEDLNSYLKSIGCKKTKLLNPHGLHHPEQVTTAFEMALITKEAMKYPIFREAVSTVRYSCPRTNLEFERNFVQTNQLLRKGAYYYPKAIGIKTGTMTASGKNLVAAAQDGDRLLIAVILGCDTAADRYHDAIKCFEAAFNQPKRRRYLLPKGAEQLSKQVLGASSVLKTYLPEGLYYDFYPAEDVKVKASVVWHIPPLPIEKDQFVGVCRVLDQKGNVLQENPILCKERILPSRIYKIKKFFAEGKKLPLLFLLLGSWVLVFFLRKSRKNRSNRVFH